MINLSAKKSVPYLSAFLWESKLCGFCRSSSFSVPCGGGIWSPVFTSCSPSQGKYRPIWLLGMRASLQPAELFLQRWLLDSAKHSASVQFEDLMMPGAAKWLLLVSSPWKSSLFSCLGWKYCFSVLLPVNDDSTRAFSSSFHELFTSCCCSQSCWIIPADPTGVSASGL